MRDDFVNLANVMKHCPKKPYCILVIALSVVLLAFTIAICNTPLGKDWVDVLSALLAPIVAVGAVGIAYFQSYINHQRWKHELFDRRYAMYSAIARYIKMFCKVDPPSQEEQIEFYRAVDGARFVFGRDVEEYVSELSRNAGRLLDALDQHRYSADETERKALQKEIGEIREWFIQQIDDLDNRFEKYLALE